MTNTTFSVAARTLTLGTLLTFGAAQTFAATLNLSYNQTAAGIAGAGAITDATAANSYNYGNSYGSLNTTLYTPASGPSANINFEFYDDYVFTIGGATVNSVSSTINLGNIFAIENLQARLYNASAQSSLPVLGSPVGGVIEAWSSQVGPGGNIAITVLNDVLLNAGTYVLELRGSVSGQAGGSYSGVMNVAPVPTPGALWLFGSGLLGMLSLRRKQRG
jgi:hypothetical protein